jgi:hypothetical protein
MATTEIQMANGRSLLLFRQQGGQGFGMRDTLKKTLKRLLSARVFSVRCQVTRKQLTDIVNRFAKDQFYVSVGSIEENDPLYQHLLTHCPEMLPAASVKEPDAVILRTDKSVFLSFVDLLLESDAEVIVFYFPDSASDFEHSITSGSDLGQAFVVSQGLCSIISTWVTNNYELFFHYNPKAFPADIKKTIKKTLESPC